MNRAIRIGIGTPQANPTVEPELHRLLDPYATLYISRLTSQSTESEHRLHDYFTGVDHTLRQYGGMRLDVFGFACTASTYLVGRPAEDERFAELERRYGFPLISACAAIEQTLQQHGASRITLISPYPEWLNHHCRAYWSSRGFTVTGLLGAGTASDDTYGIYQLAADTLDRVLREASELDTDALLVTGTGMPSLDSIVRLRDTLAVPLLSSNLCLARALAGSQNLNYS